MLERFVNSGGTIEHWYRIPQALLFWFHVCSFINMTLISPERLNATFWPFRHRTVKKSVYWVLIISIWLAALLFSCTWTLIIGYYYTDKRGYYHYVWGSFISICLLVICVSYVFILSIFALEISLDTMAWQIGKGNWPWRCSPWLLSLSYCGCLML